MALLALSLFAASCGGEDDEAGTTLPRPASTNTQQFVEPESSPSPDDPEPPAFEPARCPAGAGNCSVGTGRVIAVEAVDPDGDGDAHLVLASADSVTAPGITVLDVRKGLRPQPLPSAGALVSGAGPVFRGSYGQRQIQVDVISVAEPD